VQVYSSPLLPLLYRIRALDRSLDAGAEAAYGYPFLQLRLRAHTRFNGKITEEEGSINR